jgi:LysR family transcriptional activator of glutamate synthase operon
MNTIYLREFICLAEVQNYLEAADMLYISQSTLSRHIQSLEESLGVPLFIRTTRSVALSEFGQIFLPYARKMTAVETEGLKAIHRKKHTPDTLNIGSVSVMTQYNISGVLAEFQKTHPHLTMHITENTLPVLKKQLTAGECDFIFIQEAYAGQDEFVHIPFAADRLVAVLPKDHPLASASSVTIEDLKRDSFLLLPETTLVYKQFMKLCARARITPRIAAVVKNGDTAAGMAAKGMGVTVLMEQTAHYLCREDTAIVQLEPFTHSCVNILYPKNRSLSDAASCFLHYIKNR